MTATARALPPLPVPDAVTRPYWEAALRGRLAIQRCANSGRYLHPPQRLCPCCAASDLAFEAVSGRGNIYSFVVMRDQRVLGFEDRVPYVNVWVELVEQPLLIVVSNLAGAGEEELAIGLPVQVTFERVTGEIALPQFRLVRPAGGPG